MIATVLAQFSLGNVRYKDIRVHEVPWSSVLLGTRHAGRWPTAVLPYRPVCSAAFRPLVLPPKKPGALNFSWLTAWHPCRSAPYGREKDVDTP